MALVVQSSLWLKVEYLSSTFSEVFADFQRQTNNKSAGLFGFSG